mmetsp:Transcript_4708/g.5320  ORF Transcript_4708/g.5320 Transcript_4708/m.5320 type:complete len:241 (-) Transcript_4708:152-874(-)
MATQLKVGIGALSMIGGVLMYNWTSEHMSPLTWDQGKSFSWHPILMYTGFAVMAIVSIFQFRSQGKPLPTRRNNHFLWMTPAVLCCVVGTFAAYKHHGDKNIPHFYSLHSWIGIAAVANMCLMYLGGIPAFLLELPPLKLRQKFGPIHGIIGLMTVLLGLISILLGVMEKLSFYKGSPKSCSEGTVECLKANAFACLTALLLILVVVFWILNPSRLPTNKKKDTKKENQTGITLEKKKSE